MISKSIKSNDPKDKQNLQSNNFKGVKMPYITGGYINYLGNLTGT